MQYQSVHATSSLALHTQCFKEEGFYEGTLVF